MTHATPPGILARKLRYFAPAFSRIATISR